MRPRDVDEAVGVEVREVAGAQPAVVGPRRRVGPVVLVVLAALSGEPHQQLADLVRGPVVVGVGVDDLAPPSAAFGLPTDPTRFVGLLLRHRDERGPGLGEPVGVDRPKPAACSILQLLRASRARAARCRSTPRSDAERSAPSKRGLAVMSSAIAGTRKIIIGWSLLDDVEPAVDVELRHVQAGEPHLHRVEDEAHAGEREQRRAVQPTAVRSSSVRSSGSSRRCGGGRATPFGRPVVPDVYMMSAMSSASSGTWKSPRRRIEPADRFVPSPSPAPSPHGALEDRR